MTIGAKTAGLRSRGKPIVERVMDTLVANGIREFVLVVSPDDPAGWQSTRLQTLKPG